jgi:sortase A
MKALATRSRAPRSRTSRGAVATLALVGVLLSSCGTKNSTAVLGSTTTAAAVTTSTTAAPATTTATTVATTVATAAPAATTTAAPVATPEPTTTVALPAETVKPPAVASKPPADAAPDDLGFVEIPKIGLRERMLEGIELSILDNGAGHWPGTAMPGEKGNLVLAGHRVSHTKPFRNIDQLEAGDEVFISTNGKKFRYEVTGHEIVTPDAVRIIDPTPDATATLFACHPPGSTTYRWVTYLKYAP